MDVVEALTKAIDRMIIIDIITNQRGCNIFKTGSNIGKYKGLDFIGITQFKNEITHGVKLVLKKDNMYKKEVEKMLRDLFQEDWMDEDDWIEFLVELEKMANVSVETLSEQIEIGVKNGHSVEKQMELIKLIFDKLK